MTYTRKKMKGRANRHGSFSALIHEYFVSTQYAKLTSRAVKALIDLYCQYRGANNGDLCAAWKIMHERGWRSKDQLAKALRELESTQWIIRTRQGGIHAPTLYALTFLGIDSCGGKLDSGITADSKPLHLWRLPSNDTPNRSRRGVKKKLAPHDTGHSAPPHGAQIMPLRQFVSHRAGQS